MGVSEVAECKKGYVIIVAVSEKFWLMEVFALVYMMEPRL